MKGDMVVKDFANGAVPDADDIVAMARHAANDTDYDLFGILWDLGLRGQEHRSLTLDLSHWAWAEKRGNPHAAAYLENYATAAVAAIKAARS